MSTVNFNHYFPDYEILGQIGLANARVLKARHRATGDFVALKHYPINADEETLARFQRESQIMTSAIHPNIVKIREVQLASSLPYIVMEYIPGGDVRSLLKELGHLDVPTVIHLGQQMVEALRVIHDLDIIHRDIKPDNILYQRMSHGELHFLLTDFGISRLRGSHDATITGQSPMTPEYASPEQFEDSKKVSFATDYYSLGVVLYECLGGKVPFSQGTMGIGSFYRVLEKEAPPAIKLTSGSILPEILKGLVMGLLEKNPILRLCDPGHLRHSLKRGDLEWEGLHLKNTDQAKLTDSASKNKTVIKQSLFPIDNDNLLKRANEYRKRFDYANALNIYNKLAEQGDASSLCILGHMYHNGEGVKQDYAIAFKWYQKSANKGNAIAQYELGCLYEDGLGVIKSKYESIRYYELAAKQNHKAAKGCLHRLKSEKTWVNGDSP